MRAVGDCSAACACIDNVSALAWESVSGVSGSEQSGAGAEAETSALQGCIEYHHLQDQRKGISSQENAVYRA